MRYNPSRHRLPPFHTSGVLLVDKPLEWTSFDVVNFEKTDSRFDIWLDEKKVLMREDKVRASVISHGFGDYHTIRDFPIRGRSTYLHVRKRKWLDKDTGEIFSYDWELSEYDETHLNAEFVSFLKDGD